MAVMTWPIIVATRLYKWNTYLSSETISLVYYCGVNEYLHFLSTNSRSAKACKTPAKASLSTHEERDGVCFHEHGFRIAARTSHARDRHKWLYSEAGYGIVQTTGLNVLTAPLYVALAMSLWTCRSVSLLFATIAYHRMHNTPYQWRMPMLSLGSYSRGKEEC